MTYENKKVSELTRLLLHLGTKLAALEKKAVDLGTGEKLFPSELHTIEAIGKGNGQTVTELCQYFDVTKGAVSQIISRLEKKGYVEKQRNSAYSKEINISLSKKGVAAFRGHQALHRKMDAEIATSLQDFSKKEIILIESFLRVAEKHVQKFIDL